MKSILAVVIVFALAIGGVVWFASRAERDKPEPHPKSIEVRADDPAAVAALEKLGAIFERDAGERGRPVVGLTLRGMDIDDARMKHVAGLPRLRSLTLEGTRTTDAGLMSLAKLEALESLSLDAVGVGDAGIVHLQNLRKLQKLSVRSSPITDEGLKSLAGLTALR